MTQLPFNIFLNLTTSSFSPTSNTNVPLYTATHPRRQ